MVGGGLTYVGTGGGGVVKQDLVAIVKGDADDFTIAIKVLAVCLVLSVVATGWLVTGPIRRDGRIGSTNRHVRSPWLC